MVTGKRPHVIGYNGFLPDCPHVSIVLKEEYLVKILLHIYPCTCLLLASGINHIKYIEEH